MGNAHRAVVEVLHHSHDEPMPVPRWLPRWGAVLKVLEPEMSQGEKDGEVHSHGPTPQ